MRGWSRIPPWGSYGVATSSKSACKRPLGSPSGAVGRPGCYPRCYPVERSRALPGCRRGDASASLCAVDPAARPNPAIPSATWPAVDVASKRPHPAPTSHEFHVIERKPGLARGSSGGSFPVLTRRLASASAGRTTLHAEPSLKWMTVTFVTFFFDRGLSCCSYRAPGKLAQNPGGGAAGLGTGGRGLLRSLARQFSMNGGACHATSLCFSSHLVNAAQVSPLPART